MKYTFSNSKLTNLSQCLRKNMTIQERKLWYEFLKTHKNKFRRQRVIGRYIVDFYCAEKNLVIEIDGSQHYDEESITRDTERTEYLTNKGLTVLRYSNYDINTNFRGVCEDINKFLESH